MKPTVVVKGQWGLGDNIYARPHMRVLAERVDLYLETPWPELYEGMPLRFLRGTRRLRTQMKNIERVEPWVWSPEPERAQVIVTGYSGSSLTQWGIVGTYDRQIPLNGASYNFDLPEMGPCPIKRRYPKRPLAVVRPVTIRTEWRNEARNPLPEYVNQIAGWLCDTHEVIAVADLATGQEWLEGPPPPAHQSLLAGELPVRELMALIQHADLVTGGVGWIVPASIACRTPLLCILGGHGAHNHPSKITDPRMDLSRVGFIYPERFCQCSTMRHQCNKRIPDLEEKFRTWMEQTFGRDSRTAA